MNGIFDYCLFEDGEDTQLHTIGEGVKTRVGFHPERLEEKKNEIIEMIADLPDSFQKSEGGGMSFLNMCEDRDRKYETIKH